MRKLLDAILTATEVTHLPAWAQTGARLPDGRTAFYAETLCTPDWTIAVHQFLGAPPTVLIEQPPSGEPRHLTPHEARSLASALLTASTLTP